MQQFLLFFFSPEGRINVGVERNTWHQRAWGRLLECDGAHLLSSGEKHHHHQHFRNSTRVPLTSAFLTQLKTKSVFFKLSPSLRTCNPNSFIPLRASVTSPHPWVCVIYADKSFSGANYGLYWLPETKLQLQGGEKPSATTWFFLAVTCAGGKKVFDCLVIGFAEGFSVSR